MKILKGDKRIHVVDKTKPRETHFRETLYIGSIEIQGHRSKRKIFSVCFEYYGNVAIVARDKPRTIKILYRNGFRCKFIHASDSIAGFTKLPLGVIGFEDCKTITRIPIATKCANCGKKISKLSNSLVRSHIARCGGSLHT